MNKKDIKTSFDKISPTEEQKEKMLETIISANQKKGVYSRIKRYIPVTAAAVFVICAALIVPDIFTKPIVENFTSDSTAAADSDLVMMQTEKTLAEIYTPSETYPATKNPEPTEDLGYDSYIDIHIAQAQQTIVFSGRKYRCATDYEVTQYGLKPVISQSDMGEFIAFLDNPPVPELQDAEVCRLKGSDSEAIVLVYDYKNWYYYIFENFVSYEKNQDENASEYLKVFGVSSADDILSITVTDFTIPAKSLSRTQISLFYDGFKGLVNSSDTYFKAISEYPRPEIPDQTPTVITDDNGNTIGMTTPAYPGSSALDKSVCFTLTFDNNYTREIWYYPNIDYLSRYKLSSEFSAYLNSLY